MSDESSAQPQPPQRLTPNDRHDWRAYWMAQGRLWRTGVETGVERKRLLQRLARGAFLIALLVILASLSLAGCGNTGVSVNHHFKLATEFPVSGPDAPYGLPAQYAVDLAVSQNTNLGAGYTLTAVNMDDEGDPNVGLANVVNLASDPSVMEIVGPLDSTVAVAEIPAITTKGLAEISPTNTNPGLTISAYAPRYGIPFATLHPTGLPEYYFRISNNDVVQGDGDAKFAGKVARQGQPALHVPTAFVVDDTTAYGVGLADYFTRFFTSSVVGGATVGARTSITPATLGTLPQLAAEIEAAKPDVVFYGGFTSGGGCKLVAALATTGYQHPVIGGAGIAGDPACAADIGQDGIVFATAASPDPALLTTSPQGLAFQKSYTQFVASKPNNTLQPFAAQAYDAAMVEITAIKRLIGAGEPVTRVAIRDQIARIQYRGVSNAFAGGYTFGDISFAGPPSPGVVAPVDGNGDDTFRIFSIYVTGGGSVGKWTYYDFICP
jgi:branched-chain amino acid transport system substrate-binding protein